LPAKQSECCVTLSVYAQYTPGPRSCRICAHARSTTYSMQSDGKSRDPHGPRPTYVWVALGRSPGALRSQWGKEPRPRTASVPNERFGTNEPAGVLNQQGAAATTAASSPSPGLATIVLRTRTRALASAGVSAAFDDLGHAWHQRRVEGVIVRSQQGHADGAMWNFIALE